VSIVFRYRKSNKLLPGSPSPPCWLAGRCANLQGGEVGRRWGAPGLLSEDVSSSDRIERLALPKGESLNAIRAPRRRACRASRYSSPPAQSTPIHSAVSVPQARRWVTGPGVWIYLNRSGSWNSPCWVCGAGFVGFPGLCRVGFAGVGVLGAWGCRGRRVQSNGGSVRPGRVLEFEICLTYFQGKISVSDPCHLKSIFSQHIGASGPLCRREHSPSIHAKI